MSQSWSNYFRTSFSLTHLPLWVAWISFPLYALLASISFVPGTSENTELTNQLLQGMFTGNFAGIEPWVVVVFNLLGVLPACYGLILVYDQQKLPAWPFILGSFFSGAFSILFYVAVRHYGLSLEVPTRKITKSYNSRIPGIVLLIVGIGLISYGFLEGNFQNFLEIWTNYNLVNVMTVDFLILSIMLPVVIYDEMHRRNQYSLNKLLLFSIRVLGPCSFLILNRPISFE